MYLRDNFLDSNSSLLKDLEDTKLWEELDDIQPPQTTRWWDGTGKIDSVWKELISKIWLTDTNRISFKCFEYWVNITDPRNSLDWHQDKDEFEYEESGKVVCPSTSTVFYGYPHKVKGGYLEINEVGKDNHVEIERINPIYNRIVVFNPSRVHRVSKIYSGKRYGFQVNIWDEIPKSALPFMEGKNYE